MRHLSGLLGSLGLVVLSVIGLRACGTEPAGAPANPATFTSNGVGGVCAEQSAVAQADGGPGDSVAGAEGADNPDTSPTLISPQEAAHLKASNPQAYAALSQATGGSLSCPATSAP